MNLLDARLVKYYKDASFFEKDLFPRVTAEDFAKLEALETEVKKFEKELKEVREKYNLDKEVSVKRCQLLHEYVNRAKILTQREFLIYKELFFAINGKDRCDRKPQCEQCGGLRNFKNW